MASIPNGCILLARKIQDSDIWDKPDNWLKIWIYILLNVSHSDKKYPRGTYYFRFEWIAKDCHTTYNATRRCVEWLRHASQLATQKATHGIIITVLNYKEYQDLQNYKSQTESHAQIQTEARQKPDRSHNISNNGKNEKNVKNTNRQPPVAGVKEVMEIFYKINPTLNWANKTQRSAIEEMVKKFTLEKTIKLAEYAVSVQGQPFSPTITTPWQLKEKAAALIAHWNKGQNKKTGLNVT